MSFEMYGLRNLNITKMLEVQKKVLDGVSFSKDLFKKELLKSYLWLNQKELEELKEWVMNNFIKIHPEIIGEVFDEGLLKAV